MTTFNRVRGRCAGPLIALAAAVLSACGSDQAPQPVRILPDSLFLEPGQSTQMTVQVGDDPVVRDLGWQTGNPDVATVSSSGTVTGVGIGVTIVSATFPGGTASAPVVVGPLFVGRWSGAADSTFLSLSMNESSGPNGVTGLGTLSFGHLLTAVSASGTFFIDSLFITIRGTGITAEYRAALETADRFRGELEISGAAGELVLRRS